VTHGVGVLSLADPLDDYSQSRSLQPLVARFYLLGNMWQDRKMSGSWDVRTILPLLQDTVRGTGFALGRLLSSTGTVINAIHS